MENPSYNKPSYNTEYNQPEYNTGYNQPPYNTGYNQPPYNTGYNPSQPDYPMANQPPPPYSQNYPPPTNANVAPTGYYVTPHAVPASVPPPVGFVHTPAAEMHPPDDDHSVEAANFGGSFSDKHIRRVFVRKVYSILLVQLLFTFGIVALFIFEKNVKYFVQRNLGAYYASYAVFLVTYITLACCPAVRRRYPTNIICLIIFTMALSYMTGTISSFYDTDVVFIAAGICAGVCLGITLLSMWSKFDVTGCGLFLAMASLVAFWFGIMCIWSYNYILNTVYCALVVLLMMMFDVTGCGIYLAIASWVLFFFGFFAIIFYHRITYTIYSALFALLMMMFLAYDTQMIMGGKRHEISPEEHIIAALNLYIDIVYIFIILLGLVGRGK